MIALGIAGWSGSGKTTLLTALVGIFTQAGLRVSSVKHAHHNLQLDRPGKDSYRHAQAGAEEVILATGSGFALFSQAKVPLKKLLERLAPVDLVLVEGFKEEDAFPKLEVYRPSLGKPPLWPRMEVLAVASDAHLSDCPAPVLDLQNPAAIADFLAGVLRLDKYKR